MPVIIVEAGVQALLVLSDPVPEWSAGFLALLLVSLLALLAAVWLTVGAASAAVDGTGGLLRRAWRRPIIVAWALAVGVVAVAVSLLQLWATPLVLLVGAFVLPAAAADDPGNLFARAYRPVVRTPVRWVLAVLGGRRPRRRHVGRRAEPRLLHHRRARRRAHVALVRRRGDVRDRPVVLAVPPGHPVARRLTGLSWRGAGGRGPAGACAR